VEICKNKEDRIENSHSVINKSLKLHFSIPLIKRQYSENTTCVENMVYSAIAATRFGLYWPYSGFCNVKEKSIKAVKTVRGVLIKR